ncbi:MAG: nucleoside monophosphate kinase [Planctomycetaceae bacterium]
MPSCPAEQPCRAVVRVKTTSPTFMPGLKMSDGRHVAILLFGAPGTGKGTQGKVLGDLPGFFHLSSGDIFRSLDPDSQQGRAVGEHTSQGNLVPDDLTVTLWHNWLAERIEAADFDPAAELLLLDGIPRNVAQCQLIEAHVDVQLVLHLSSDNIEPLVQRILNRARLEGRPDDADESIVRHRFDVYLAESAPVLGFYPEERRADIDPGGTPAQVLVRVLERVIPLQEQFLAGD